MRDLAVLFKWVLLALLLTLALRVRLGWMPVTDLPLPAGLVDDQTRVKTFRTCPFPETPWVLFAGGSTMNEAVDCSLIGRECRRQTISRGYPSDIAFALNWTLKRAGKDHRPELVVWGINRISFVMRDPNPARTKVAQDRYDPEVDAHLRLEEAARQLSGTDRLQHTWNWLDPWFRQRVPIKEAVQILIRGLVDGHDGLAPGPENLFKFDTRRPSNWWAMRYARYAELGGFASRPISPVQARAVRYIIDRCRRAGIPLIVVVMPEHPGMRDHYKPGAKDDLLRLFEEEESITLLNWSDSFPDDAFADPAHLHAEGRRLFCRRIQRHIDRHLAAPSTP